MDVTLNIDELLEKRTIFEQDLLKKSMRTFLIDSIVICALAVFVWILAEMEVLELNDNAGMMFVLAILFLAFLQLFDKAAKLVRFYEGELGLTNQKAKI